MLKYPVWAKRDGYIPVYTVGMVNTRYIPVFAEYADPSTVSRLRVASASSHRVSFSSLGATAMTDPTVAGAAPAPAGASPVPRQWSQPQMPQPAVASQPPPPNQTAEEHGDSDEEEFDYGD